VGAYTTGAEVLGLLLDLGVGPTARLSSADVEAIIAGLEAEVDGILLAQGYATVPATGLRDAAMLGQQVRLKAAARVYVTLHQPQRSPDWVRTADIDWSEFLERLRRGQQRLVDQAPVAAGEGQVAVTSLRVLPKVGSGE
jgi:hypothetical protein